LKNIVGELNVSHSERRTEMLTGTVLIEVSKLSTKDSFMQYMPETTQERLLKGMIFEVIAREVKDFYRPVCDPSLLEDTEHIVYELGKPPAVGKSYDWWERTAKELSPERCSRLGTRLEYIGFLGVLLKDMVLDGWDVKKAWHALCNDSREIGAYLNSSKTTFGPPLTGSMPVSRFYDLANTYKILAEDVDKGGCWVFGGSYKSKSYRNPIAEELYFVSHTNHNPYAIGWIVFEK
jgi:hypothetical protein